MISWRYRHPSARLLRRRSSTSWERVDVFRIRYVRQKSPEGETNVAQHVSAGKTIPKKSRVPSGTTQNLWCRPAGLISTHNGRPRTHVLGSDCFALRALSRQNVGTNSPPARLPMSPAPVMSNTALRRRRNDTQYVGHTYSSTLFHVVFSTKERRPAIKEPGAPPFSPASARGWEPIRDHLITHPVGKRRRQGWAPRGGWLLKGSFDSGGQNRAASAQDDKSK